MNTNSYLNELEDIFNQIERKYPHLFQNIEKPFLLVIDFQGEEEVHFEISAEGIKPCDHSNNKDTKIKIAYQDLKRLFEKPSRTLRYILEGKIKISGEYKLVLETLKKLI